MSNGSFTDSEGESVGSIDPVRHERFVSLRAQHYLMKEDLERGRHLVESEDEE